MKDLVSVCPEEEKEGREEEVQEEKEEARTKLYSCNVVIMSIKWP